MTRYPPTFPVPCTPNDIQSNYNIGSGEDSVVVSWTVPRASDRNGGTPRYYPLVRISLSDSL
jgi:hypothetical protein